MKDRDIFTRIKPTDNDQLLKYSKGDLIDLINLINEYQLQYRPRIEAREEDTFGIEIEYQKGGMKKQQELIDKLDLGEGWKIKRDGSVPEGGELATPILHNTDEDWDKINKVCNVLKQSCKTGLSAGGHIHVGSNILKFNSINWIKFFELWMTYEHIIIKFTNGEYINARNGLSHYAKPSSARIQLLFNNHKNEINEIQSKPELNRRTQISDLIYEYGEDAYGDRDRYKALNLMNTSMYDSCNKNTIEFRCPNGTLEQIVWQNNVNLFLNMLESIETMDESIINERYEKIKALIRRKRLDYNEIYLEQAIEFCDLVFRSNLDKVYFLRQYLKGFESSLNTTKKVKFYR